MIAKKELTLVSSVEVDGIIGSHQSAVISSLRASNQDLGKITTVRTDGAGDRPYRQLESLKTDPMLRAV